MSYPLMTHNNSFLSYGATMPMSVPQEPFSDEPITNEEKFIKKETSYIYYDESWGRYVSVVPWIIGSEAKGIRDRNYNLPPKNLRRRKITLQKGMRRKGNLKQPGGASCDQRR
jgi:hypothetical protein